jgi:hypothetical protein
MVIRLTIFSMPLNHVSCDIVLVVISCELGECASGNVDAVRSRAMTEAVALPNVLRR